MELTKDEMFVIEEMRKIGPFAMFFIEKRPTKENANGALIKVDVKKTVFFSTTVKNLHNT